MCPVRLTWHHRSALGFVGDANPPSQALRITPDYVPESSFTQGAPEIKVIRALLQQIRSLGRSMGAMDERAVCGRITNTERLLQNRINTPPETVECLGVAQSVGKRTVKEEGEIRRVRSHTRMRRSGSGSKSCRTARCMLSPI